MSDEQPATATERRRYDPEMIEDFLNHLLWEVRIAHHENANRVRQTGKLNPELVDQLGRYFDKYGSTLRLPNQLDGDGASDAEIKRALEILTVEIGEKGCDAQMAHLEALRGLFESAVSLIRLWNEHDGKLDGEPVRVWTVEEVLGWETDDN